MTNFCELKRRDWTVIQSESFTGEMNTARCEKKTDAFCKVCAKALNKKRLFKSKYLARQQIRQLSTLDSADNSRNESLPPNQSSPKRPFSMQRGLR